MDPKVPQCYFIRKFPTFLIYVVLVSNVYSRMLVEQTYVKCVETDSSCSAPPNTKFNVIAY
jgi:hypothetical protein